MATLEQCWPEVCARAEASPAFDYLDDSNLIESIRDSLADSTDKTYHYVLITQLVSKVTNAALNARSLQERADVDGSFDPRSVCKKVIVPFDRAQLDGALGRSPDPYVNNPVRVPLLTKADRGSKSDPEMWDKLCDLVDIVEAKDEAFARNLFLQVLLEIYRKLGTVEIRYDVPLRASLVQVIAATESFSEEKSGGDRPLALAAALFQIIGKYFKLFQPEIRRGKINASDAAAGQVADLECIDAGGRVVLAVEVKDRTVTVSDLEEKLGATRKKAIREVFFLSGRRNAQTRSAQTDDVAARVAKEFSAGQNLYVFHLIDLARSVLALAGEEPRREFLLLVGRQLDEFSDTKHRLAWKRALQQMATALK
ncbi:MAG: restriction endonuclease, SacI family [Bryobacteraceae bacterium]